MAAPCDWLSSSVLLAQFVHLYIRQMKKLCRMFCWIVIDDEYLRCVHVVDRQLAIKSMENNGAKLGWFFVCLGFNQKQMVD